MKWLEQSLGMVAELTLVHLAISVPAILLSLLIAVPLGRLAFRRRWVGGPLLALVGVTYAIPSIALLIIVPSLLGTPLRSPSNLVIVLTIYGVAILSRGVADAFAAVPAETLTAADAIGYSRTARFWVIELPLAAPLIIAALRVVVVSTISLVTIGSIIGISSLGTLFTDGFQRGIVAEVVTGLVMTVVLAFALDGLCVLGERALLPWTRRRPRAARRTVSA
jgi:osmoprotectant transport system permease protein